MADNRLQVVIDLKDNITASLDKVKGNLNSFSDTIQRGEDASKTFAKGILVAGTALAGIGGFALKSASDIQQTQVAFKTMLGSAEKAQEFVAKMKEFARTTPLETSDIAQASQTLLAFGIESKNVLPNLRMIGDVALGNQEKFKMLSLAFAQVQSTGKLMGQDLLQMVNQGFNPLQIISEKTGESMESLKDKMSKGAISAAMVTEAFKTATSAGGRFYGGMEAQSKTFAGQLSTLKDDLNLAFAENVGKPLLEAMTKLIPVVQNLISKIPALIEKIKEISQYFEENKTVMYIVAGAIVGALVPAVWAAVVAFGAWAIALAPFMIAGAVIAGIIAGIVWIVKNWDMLKAKADEVWTSITTTVLDAVDKIVTPVISFFSAMWDGLKTIFNGIVDFFRLFWDGLVMLFKFQIALATGIVIGAFNLLGIDIVGIFEGLKIFFSAFWQWLTTDVVEATTKVLSVVSTWLSNIKAGFMIVWTAIRTFVSQKWNELTGDVSSGMSTILEYITKFTEPITNAFSKIWDGVKVVTDLAFEGIKWAFKGVINFLIDGVNKLVQAINSVANKGAGVVGLSIPNIPEVPRLAKGGIVNKPTLAMIGEDGPEAVVPLTKKNAPAGMSGGVTVNITVNGDISGEELIEKIGNELTRRLQLSTALT